MSDTPPPPAPAETDTTSEDARLQGLGLRQRGSVDYANTVDLGDDSDFVDDSEGEEEEEDEWEDFSAAKTRKRKARGSGTKVRRKRRNRGGSDTDWSDYEAAPRRVDDAKKRAAAERAKKREEERKAEEERKEAICREFYESITLDPTNDAQMVKFLEAEVAKSMTQGHDIEIYDRRMQFALEDNDSLWDVMLGLARVPMPLTEDINPADGRHYLPAWWHDRYPKCDGALLRIILLAKSCEGASILKHIKDSREENVTENLFLAPQPTPEDFEQRARMLLTSLAKFQQLGMEEQRIVETDYDHKKKTQKLENDRRESEIREKKMLDMNWRKTELELFLREMGAFGDDYMSLQRHARNKDYSIAYKSLKIMRQVGQELMALLHQYAKDRPVPDQQPSREIEELGPEGEILVRHIYTLRCGVNMQQSITSLMNSNMAKKLLNKMRLVSILRMAVRAHPKLSSSFWVSTISVRHPSANDLPAYWKQSSKFDFELVRGVLKHGFINVEDIIRDPELPFGGYDDELDRRALEVRLNYIVQQGRSDGQIRAVTHKEMALRKKKKARNY